MSISETGRNEQAGINTNFLYGILLNSSPYPFLAWI